MLTGSNLASPTCENERFRSCQHALASLNKMESYFLRQQLTDVVLIAGNKRISAHRLVLSASSEYFAAMFTGNLCEATQNEIELQKVDGEALLTLALMTWLEHDLPSRTAEISKLLSFIKLSLLSPSFIVDHMESVPLFRDNLKCTELIMEAFKYHLLPERRAWLKSARTLPRKSTLGDLYAIGGNDIKKGELSIEKYNPRMNKWTHTTNTNICRRQFGVAAMDEKIYMIGGRDDVKILGAVDFYDLKKETWTNLPKLLTQRYDLGVGVLEGYLYAVGGHDGRSFLNTAERWDPKDKVWRNIAPMLSQRSTLGVTVLNGKLYAVGGRDENCCLKTVECYDPHTNKWTACAPMIRRRGCVGVGVLNGYIYAVGGSDEPCSSIEATGRRLECVERYNPKSDIWCLVASLSTGRDAIGVCLLGERLFAVGGYDGKSYLKLVETYNPEKNQWKQVSPLNKERAGACVVAIKLSNNGSA